MYKRAKYYKFCVSVGGGGGCWLWKGRASYWIVCPEPRVQQSSPVNTTYWTWDLWWTEVGSMVSRHWSITFVRLSHKTQSVSQTSLTLEPLSANIVVLVRFLIRLNHCHWKRNVCLNIKICKGLVSNKTCMSIFTHLKLWVAVARHNFKWVEI